MKLTDVRLWADTDTRHYVVETDDGDDNDAWLVEVSDEFAFVIFRDWLFIASECFGKSDEEIIARAVDAYAAKEVSS